MWVFVDMIKTHNQADIIYGTFLKGFTSCRGFSHDPTVLGDNGLDVEVRGADEYTFVFVLLAFDVIEHGLMAAIGQSLQFWWERSGLSCPFKIFINFPKRCCSQEGQIRRCQGGNSLPQ